MFATRRSKVLDAVDFLLESLKQIPIMISALKLSGRHLHKVRLLKLPRDVILVVLRHLVQEETDLIVDQLHVAKQRGYCLCRHPLFAIECGDEAPLEDIYRNTVRLHNKALCHLNHVLSKLESQARRVGWDSYLAALQQVSDVIISISISPVLAESAPISHEHFSPKQEP